MLSRRNLLIFGGLLAAVPAARMLVGSVQAASNLLLAEIYPRPSKVALIENAMIYADQRGTGRDVVLIHGASGSSRDFTFRLADKLANEGFRVTSFDRPGLGWSDSLGERGTSPLIQAQFLIAASRAFGVQKPIVLGQSYGASVALAWALIEPEYTSAVVSVAGATNVWPGGLGLWYSVSSSVVGEVFVAPMIESFATKRMALRSLEAIFAPSSVPAGYVDYIGVELSVRRETFITNAKQVAALKAHLEIMEPNYHRLKLPVEIVHGSADTIVPVAVHGQKLVGQVEKANLVVIPGAGHMPHHSHEGEVLAAVQRAAARSA